LVLYAALKRRSSTVAQTEKQIPPLRRRWRSDSGRNDGIWDAWTIMALRARSLAPPEERLRSG